MEPRHADVLLVGGGVAAARCARTLRRAGFRGAIVLVGDEQLLPYNRPPLSKELLRGEVPEELILAEPRSWYARRGVDVLLGVPAVAVDPEARIVELADGARLRFGSLLLATGAEPRPSPLPAHLLRTVTDARAIRDAAMPGRRAVVIGGGFIGVEVGASLAARGARVTLLERTPALWGGVFGSAVSAWALGRLRDAGVEVRLGVDAGPDELVGADLVVAGVGVSPRVGLAVGAGLEVDDGILVDEGQATSVPGVFAAGDVARLRGRPRVEHWHAARESGERAALAMLGQQPPTPRAPWIFSEFAGSTLDVVGVAQPGDEEVAVAGGVMGFLRDGSLAAVLVLDGAMPVEPARALVEGGGTPADLTSRIAAD